MNTTELVITGTKLTFNTKIGNQMQNLYCRNVRNVKFPKIVAEKFAFYMQPKEVVDFVPGVAPKPPLYTAWHAKSSNFYGLNTFGRNLLAS